MATAVCGQSLEGSVEPKGVADGFLQRSYRLRSGAPAARPKGTETEGGLGKLLLT